MLVLPGWKVQSTDWEIFLCRLPDLQARDLRRLRSEKCLHGVPYWKVQQYWGNSTVSVLFL